MERIFLTRVEFCGEYNKKRNNCLYTAIGMYYKGQFLRFNRIGYLMTGKGRRIVKIPRPFFLASTASVSTKAFLLGRYASLCSARYICLPANSICPPDGRTRYDINPRSRSEHIECKFAERTHISNALAYIENPRQADLYRCVVSLRTLRYTVSFL